MGTTSSSYTFYHVTTAAAATKIISSGKLGDAAASSWEAGYQFVFTELPTLSQAKLAGIGSKAETVVKFETKYNPITAVDNGVDESLQSIARVSNRPGLFDIINAQEVGFQKSWWNPLTWFH